MGLGVRRAALPALEEASAAQAPGSADPPAYEDAVGSSPAAGERTDVMHTVALTDTLVGIALRYDVDVRAAPHAAPLPLPAACPDFMCAWPAGRMLAQAAAIRRANRLFTSNVQERKQLVIPLARSGSTGPLPPTATERTLGWG